MATPASAFHVEQGVVIPVLTRGLGCSTSEYRRAATVYSQGDKADAVFAMTRGRVLLSVVNPHGKEAVVAMVGPGEFFGEECIREAEVRGASAVTLERSTLVRIEKQDLRQNLRNSAEFCENFLNHLLYRKSLAEEALADQLFSSSERRLARVLMVLARNPNLAPLGTVPRMSQTTLAAMVGTTRSRINYFLGNFRRMGLIEGGSTLRVNVARMESMLAE